MNKATFTTEYASVINEHFGNTVFDRDLIIAGKRLIDELSPMCSEITEWHPGLAQASLEALNKEALLKDTKVVNGVTTAEHHSTEAEVVEMLNAVVASFEELPDSMKVVALEGARIVQAVMEKAAA